MHDFAVANESHLVIPPGAGALCLGPVLHPHGPRAGAVDPLRGRAEIRGRAGTEAPEESDGDPGRCPTVEVKGWLEWNGMEWNGMEWNGMEWNGMEWNGMEWNGMEWNGS